MTSFRTEETFSLSKFAQQTRRVQAGEGDISLLAGLVILFHINDAHTSDVAEFPNPPLRAMAVHYWHEIAVQQGKTSMSEILEGISNQELRIALSKLLETERSRGKRFTPNELERFGFKFDRNLRHD